jgi:beta-N-acetylhexosaminidase
MARIAPTTLETRVGQLLFVGFEGLTAPDYLLDWLRAGRVGGVILFARNVASPEQVATLTDTLTANAPYGVIISIDQEGGTVARLRDGFTESPGAMALASATDAERLTEQVAGVLAAELRALGIHWDYAPVVDINQHADNPSMGTRTFGADPDRVSRLAAAAVRGLQAAGIAACPKHFPGAGNTSVDTHVALPALDTPLDHLRAVDLPPYRAAIAAGAASVMVTHVLYRTLDPDHPSTLSPIVVRTLLRGELGYDGVVTTDCMEMQAITNHYGAAESAVLAALASIDAILFSHTREKQEAAYAALLDAAHSGRLPASVIDAANRRLAAFKDAFLLPRADLGVIRSADHLALMAEAARAGTMLVRGGTAIPLDAGRSIGVIEFPSALESGIGEVDGLTGFSRLLRARVPSAEVVTVTDPRQGEAALALAERADTLILVTRSAHLNADKIALCQRLIDTAQRTALVCLRNPHDAAALTGADTVICTCGDSAPSLAAAVDALLGDYLPTGRLPVALNLP